MTPELIKRHAGLISLGIFVLAALVAFLFFLRSVDDPTPPQMEDFAQEMRTRPRWSLPADAPSLEIRYGNEGVAISLGAGADPLFRMPMPPGLEQPKWTMQETSTTRLLSLQGRLHGGHFLATWTFVDGDPQVAFAASVSQLPGEALVHRLAIETRMAARQVRALNSSLRMEEIAIGEHARGVNWIGVDLEEAHLTLSMPFGARLDLGRDEGGPSAQLVLWEGADSPSWPEGCPSSQEEMPSLTFEARQVITIGSGPPFALSPLPFGTEAALVPVFTEPHRTDQRLGAAEDAEDWLVRARTLLYGHSSSEDPRYGNGGLLGSNFGAVLAASESIWIDPSVQDWTAALTEARVDILPQNSSLLAPFPRPVMTIEAPCEAVLKALDEGRPALLVGGEIPHGQQLSPIGMSPSLPLVIAVPSLDGRRRSLVEGVFARQELERRVKERGVTYFSTPFVATRNPLIGIAAQSLLEPEPEGEWTLHRELTRSLGRAEMMQETRQLMITSASDLHARSQALGHITIWSNEAGELIIENASDQPLRGMTLILDGDADVRVTTLQGNSVETSSREEGRQVWLWWDLEGTTQYRITRSSAGAAESELRPLRWTLAGDSSH